MSSTPRKKTYSVEEYLEFDDKSPIRYQYLDGEIRTMSGELVDIHGQVTEENELSAVDRSNYDRFCHNLSATFDFETDLYITLVNNQRLYIEQCNACVFPELMVLRQPIELKKNQDAVMNPCLIVKVLSPLSKDYDSSLSFRLYRTIKTFTEYLLIRQDRICVEHWLKTATNQWLLSEYCDPQVMLSLSSINLEFKIADLYQGVEFAEVGIN